MPTTKFNRAWLGHTTATVGGISNANVTVMATGFDQSTNSALAAGANGMIFSGIVDNALSGGNVWFKATNTGLALSGTVAQSNANTLTMIANPVTVGTGRWLVDSTRPDANRNDVRFITNWNFLRYATVFNEADTVPAGFAAGNGLVYSVTPVAGAQMADQTIVFGTGIDTTAATAGSVFVNSIAVDPDAFGIDVSSASVGAVSLAPTVTQSAGGHASAGTWVNGLVATAK